ncbi:MAG: gamma-glutamyltransferase [Spirosomataceae bacterium]
MKKYHFIAAALLVSTIACSQPTPKKTPPPRPAADSVAGSFYRHLDDDLTKPFYSDKKGVFAPNGMVASAHPVASQVGVDILKAGGNAIDAAVATFFALAVVYPRAGNIGGGGFLVFRDKKGQSYTLDFREKAPLSASKDMYLDESGKPIPGMSWAGHSASGVPGSVAGAVEMHKRFGKLSWKQVLQPAITLAENGTVLTEREASGLNSIRNEIMKHNPGKSYFLKQDSSKWQKGELLLQKDLAATLKRIQSQGKAGFYKGETAKLLLAEMQKSKAPFTQEDLDKYDAVWRDPITCQYKNYKLITMPPSSSGGVVLKQLMKFVEKYPLNRWGWHSDSTTQVMIEAERRAYADRSVYLGDMDFVKVPINEMTSEAYLKKRWEDFSFEKATDSKNLKAGVISTYESLETTHFSIVDKEGNAVAITTTINNSYGSMVVVKGAGFLMNDEMDDFSIKPGVPNAYGLIGAKANAIEPSKRMLSAMTPTILEKNGKLYMVVGTPGGSTIITSVFQTILNVIEHGMSMQESVNALKFHHQWLPDVILYEKGGFSDKTIEKLKAKGYNMSVQQGTLGRMDCILVLPDGTLEGGSDPRAENTSIGY